MTKEQLQEALKEFRFWKLHPHPYLKPDGPTKYDILGVLCRTCDDVELREWHRQPERYEAPEEPTL